MSVAKYFKEHKSKLVITSIIYVAFFVYALRFASIGTALLDLQIQFQESFSTTSWIISAYSIGYLLGASIAGYVEKLYHNHTIQAVTFAFCGVTLFLVPFFTNIHLVFPILMLGGISSAVFETVTYVALIDIWGKSVGNYMQILYLSFGVGGMVTPIAIRPFQLPIPEDIVDPDAYLAYYKPEDVQIKYPLFVESILSVLLGIAFTIYHLFACRSSNQIKIQEQNDENEKKVEEVETEQKKIPAFKIFISVAWVAFLGHTGFSMQLIFNVFAQAYGVKSKLRMEKRKAALIGTTYWVAVSIGQLFFICFNNLIGEKFLSICCTTLLSIGLMISFTLANTYEICYWLVALFLGLGFGPLFVVAFSHLEKFFHITGQHTSFICVVFIIGETCHIPIVGAWIDQYPDVFLYYYGILGVLFVIGFASLGYVCELLFGKPEEARLQEVSQKPRNSFVMIPITERRESVISFRRKSTAHGQA